MKLVPAEIGAIDQLQINSERAAPYLCFDKCMTCCGLHGLAHAQCFVYGGGGRLAGRRV